jgi:hypothetical protein
MLLSLFFGWLLVMFVAKRRIEEAKNATITHHAIIPRLGLAIWVHGDPVTTKGLW